MNRLEYTKEVLIKVQFDKKLLAKEYIKAMKLLTAKERLIINAWCAKELGGLDFLQTNK